MKEKHQSQKENRSARFNFQIVWLSLRSMALVLLVALHLANLGGTASAQTCWELCQMGLSQCLHAAEGDPLAEARCQDDYDKCGADCM